MFENLTNLLKDLIINNFFYFLLILIVLTVLDQIPPFIFIIPLLLIYISIIYFLFKIGKITLIILLPMLLSFFSFIGDIIYLKLFKRKLFSDMIQNKTPIKIKENVQFIKIRDLFYSRLSPIYKIIIYENNREKILLNRKFIIFLFLSHLFFFYLITIIVSISLFFSNVIGFKKFDWVFVIISLFLLTKIIKIDFNENKRGN